MGSFTNGISLLSEFKNRKQNIDPQLEKQGWPIKGEFKSVKSIFNYKTILFFDEKLHSNLDRFIDCFLLDKDYTLLDTIETKIFFKDAKTVRILARTYAQDIESQTNQKVPIFLTNSELFDIGNLLNENTILKLVIKELEDAITINLQFR